MYLSHQDTLATAANLLSVFVGKEATTRDMISIQSHTAKIGGVLEFWPVQLKATMNSAPRRA